MTFKNPYLLALFSGLLLWLSWPPFNYTGLLLFVAFIPLFFALEQQHRAAERNVGKKIFWTAFLALALWNTASIYWVYNAISAYNGPWLALPVSIIPFALGPLILALAFWLYFKLKPLVSKFWAYAGFISLYIAFEYLQQVWDLAFPWMNLGNGFAVNHQWIQWYEYTGIYGGSLWVLLVNILLFESIKNWRTAQGYARYRLGMISILVILVPLLASLKRYYNYTEENSPANIVVVQPNIDPYQKFESISSQAQIEILKELSIQKAKANTEYFIWPETAIPNYANEDRISESNTYEGLQKFLLPYRNASLITGIESIKTYEQAKTATAKYDDLQGIWYDNFNAAMQVEPGSQVQFYHKSKLVPGVEKIPFPQVFSFMNNVFSELGGSVGGWGWQESPGVFYASSGVGVTPAICYESLWGDWIGASVKQGSQFIAIITNDGWWGNTAGKDQHLLYAKLRAIETRRYVARSANTGISAIINQRGDILQQTQWWTRTALNADINLNDALTPYVKGGDLIAKLSALFAAFFLFLIPLRRWTSKKLK